MKVFYDLVLGKGFTKGEICCLQKRKVQQELIVIIQVLYTFQNDL